MANSTRYIIAVNNHRSIGDRLIAEMKSKNVVNLLKNLRYWPSDDIKLEKAINDSLNSNITFIYYEMHLPNVLIIREDIYQHLLALLDVIRVNSFPEDILGIIENSKVFALLNNNHREISLLCRKIGGIELDLYEADKITLKQ